MALQIEAPETLRKIEEIARRTGASAESVVENAVQAEFDRLRESEEEAQRRTEIYALVEELRAMFREVPDLVTDPAELLYDENGLPK